MANDAAGGLRHLITWLVAVMMLKLPSGTWPIMPRRLASVRELCEEPWSGEFTTSLQGVKPSYF